MNYAVASDENSIPNLYASIIGSDPHIFLQSTRLADPDRSDAIGTAVDCCIPQDFGSVSKSD
jgi:hypothetical protein